MLDYEFGKFMDFIILDFDILSVFVILTVLQYWFNTLFEAFSDLFEQFISTFCFAVV